MCLNERRIEYLWKKILYDIKRNWKVKINVISRKIVVIIVVVVVVVVVLVWIVELVLNN